MLHLTLSLCQTVSANSTSSVLLVLGHSVEDMGSITSHLMGLSDYLSRPHISVKYEGPITGSYMRCHTDSHTDSHPGSQQNVHHNSCPGPHPVSHPENRISSQIVNHTDSDVGSHTKPVNSAHLSLHVLQASLCNRHT